MPRPDALMRGGERRVAFTRKTMGHMPAKTPPAPPIAFEVTDRDEGFEDHFAVLFVGLLFFWGEDAELAGESMAIGIEAATALAFWGLGTCGMVGTLDQVGLVAGHISFPLH